MLLHLNECMYGVWFVFYTIYDTNIYISDASYVCISSRWKVSGVRAKKRQGMRRKGQNRS